MKKAPSKDQLIQKGHTMPLSAPTTANARALSMQFVDRRGDRTAVRVRIAADATEADIIELVEATAAASQASIFRFTIESVFEETVGQGASDALTGSKDSADDMIVIGLKNPAQGANDEFYIPAPLPALFNDGTENVNTANALYTAVRGELLDVLLPGWRLNQVRFTERREINAPRQPA